MNKDAIVVIDGGINAIQWLEPIQDGDSAAIEEFIYNWHPAYVEHEKISDTQIGERAKDF